MRTRRIRAGVSDTRPMFPTGLGGPLSAEDTISDRRRSLDSAWRPALSWGLEWAAGRRPGSSVGGRPLAQEGREAAMTDRASETDQANRSAVAQRTRRQLLAGGTGALAAVLTAEALTRPTPAAAANGDTVILGQGNSETLPTVFVNSADGVAALAGTATGSGTGVIGNSDSGDAVLGTSV